MDDLTAFVTARLDEDERIAQGAARTDDGHDGRWLPFCFRAGGFDARVDDHIARHDPARVLREVAAGRKLIAFALENAEDADGERGDGHDAAEIASGQCADHGMEAAAGVLGPLAAIWDDHPDYRQEWKP